MVKTSPFIRRFKLWTGLILMLIVMISYVTLFLPYKSALEKTTLENFVLLSKASLSTIDQFILRNQENAKVFSHILLEHGQLEAYEHGDITLESLKQTSAESFLKEAARQPHIISAVRLLNGSVNAAIGSEYLPALLSQPESFDADHLQTAFLTGRDRPGLFIAVPLNLNGDLYGYDLILYDLGGLEKPLSRDNLTHAFVNLHPQESLYHIGAKMIEAGGATLYDNGLYTGFCLPVEETRQALHVSIENEVLYERVEDIVHLNLLGFAMAAGIVLFLSHQFIIQHIRHVMGHAEKTKRKYLELANRDQLTGTFSRRYLEEWKLSNAPLSLLEMIHAVVVMVDVNDLKVINDTYGHKAGDEALKYVAKVMGRTLRTEDVIIRYGGDEFLVILSGCLPSEAEHIFSRVNQALSSDQPFDFNLSISYGIEPLTKVEHMDEAIHTADEKMYALKARNRAALI